MKIEKTEHTKEGTIVLFIGLFIVLGYWFTNVFYLQNEIKTERVIQISKIVFWSVFAIKAIEFVMVHLLVNVFYFYQTCKNNERLYKINKTFDKEYKQYMKTDKIFYHHGSDKDFVNQGIQVLNSLPHEINKILKIYPTNFNFKKAERELHLGVRTLHNKKIKTNSITLFSLEEYPHYVARKMRSTIFHELGHHIDNVIGEVYYGKGEFFSEKDEIFDGIYKKDLVYLDEYFLEKKSEFFAETVSLYFLGKLSSKELNDYYEKLFDDIMNLINNEKVR